MSVADLQRPGGRGSDSGQSTSVWMATADAPSFEPLAASTRASVCVIGAGVAGMTTAYLLASQGASVIVLDDGPIAGGQTGRTTAHLANAIDDRYTEIERIHGWIGAQLAAASHSAAIELIETIVAEERIDCDFERLDGFLFVPAGESAEVLDRELEAARRAGLIAVERYERVPLVGFETGPCLRFPRQGQIHPRKYLNGLARAILRDGGRICTGTHAATIEGGAPARVTTGSGAVVTADAVVVATNSPINDRIAIHTKQAPYLTYVIAARVPRGSVFRALYWDTLDPYHYVRLQADDSGPAAAPTDLLIVGGEDHKTGQADDAEQRYARLEAWARQRFPMMQDVAYRWSGQVLETIDGLAFIGRNPGDAPNVYIATGDSGMGMTHGTIAGMLLSDLILGRENPWAALYDPARKPVDAAGEFFRENLNVAGQYTDWLTGGDVRSVAEIAPGTGAVIRRMLKKIAVFRDQQGVLHERSAVCPHLGCIVAWNHSEQTWDCPCHGSRYDRHGRVLNGPSNTDLGRA